MFTDKQIEELNKPLDPKHVTKPNSKFGPKGDYIQGWHAINEANRIFGYDNWSYEIDLQKTSQIKNEKDNVEITFMCIAKLMVGGVTRQAVGHGSGAAKKEGDAYEGAIKEAETDALKRALRTFGNQFGLALYDKERVNVQAPPIEYINDDQLHELQTIAQSNNVDIINFCRVGGVKSLKDIATDKFNDAKIALQTQFSNTNKDAS